MTAPLLDVQNLTTSFRRDGAWREVVHGVSFTVAPRETVALVGESGSGKSVSALSLMRPHPARLEPQRRPRPVRGPRPPGAARGGDAPHPRRRHRDGVPGADDEPEPGADHRLPGVRKPDAAPWHDARRRRGRGGAAARPRPHPGGALAPAGLPAPLLGRHAPARRHRHGAGLPAEAAHRRRAHHRARRHRAGADPRPPEIAAGPGGHGGALHHPRHGRGGRDRRPHGGDAPRPRGRGRRHGRDLPRRPAPLHARASVVRAEARLDERRAPAPALPHRVDHHRRRRRAARAARHAEAGRAADPPGKRPHHAVRHPRRAARPRQGPRPRGRERVLRPPRRGNAVARRRVGLRQVHDGAARCCG